MSTPIPGSVDQTTGDGAGGLDTTPVLVEIADPMEKQEGKNNDDAKKSSSCMSTVLKPFRSFHALFRFATIAWAIPLVREGFKSPLGADRVPERSSTHRAKSMVERAEKLWAEEVARKGKKASLIRVMFKLQHYTLVTGTLVSIVQGLLFSVARPLLLRQLILTVSDFEGTGIEESIGIAVFFSFVVLLDGSKLLRVIACRVVFAIGNFIAACLALNASCLECFP
jgi:hypothetical protein